MSRGVPVAIAETNRAVRRCQTAARASMACPVPPIRNDTTALACPVARRRRPRSGPGRSCGRGSRGGGRARGRGAAPPTRCGATRGEATTPLTDRSPATSTAARPPSEWPTRTTGRVPMLARRASRAHETSSIVPRPSPFQPRTRYCRRATATVGSSRRIECSNGRIRSTASARGGPVGGRPRARRAPRGRPRSSRAWWPGRRAVGGSCRGRARCGSSGRLRSRGAPGMIRPYHWRASAEPDRR